MMTLKQIQAEKQHSTDKGLDSHTFCGRSYLDCYDEILPGIRELSGNVLEIGVLFGGSVRLWHDYFPSVTKIIGIDIDPSRKEFELPEQGIHIYIGSQADEAFLKAVCENYGPFKFILDDGSHIVTHMLQSFNYLWPSLVSGGIYAMEDLRISYHEVDDGWPGMTYNHVEEMRPNNRSTFNEWFLARLRAMDHLEGEIRRIDFHPMQIAITKV